MQTEIDYNFRHENCRNSQGILEANADRFNSQCKRLLDMLNAGAKITVREAMINHGIGDLRRRICDLRKAGVVVKDELIKNRFKVYYIENKIHNQ